jgi:hypothetical protein
VQLSSVLQRVDRRVWVALVVVATVATALFASGTAHDAVNLGATMVEYA